MRPITRYWPRERRPRVPPPCPATLGVGDVMIVHDRLRYQVMQVMTGPVCYVVTSLNPNKPLRFYEFTPYKGLRRLLD